MVTTTPELPWIDTEPIDAATWSTIRRRMMFEHFKWDPQIEDVSALGRRPLVLRRSVWQQLTRWAEAMYAEALAAEAEIAERPELIRRLGLPRPVRRLMRGGRSTPGVARVMRFDFHYAAEGWRVSEVNSDVPGGFIEAAGYCELIAQHVDGAGLVGDPSRAWAEALARGIGGGGRVTLAYATSYADDAQVMLHVERAMRAAGLAVSHAAPDTVAWGEADAVARFFPGEWIPNLPRHAKRRWFFRDCPVPMSNPGSALLTQSKRWPLTWDNLETALPVWRERVPETRPAEPALIRSDEWVFKPALGRVGEDVGVPGATKAGDWRAIAKAVRRAPGRWAMQRRFDAVAWGDPRAAQYPCVGVYVIDGVAAGAYGRSSHRALIDRFAQDVAVLVADGPSTPRTASDFPENAACA
ncbi:MAG: glutathionylspermidine synthase family protein [Planctomycetota bacterium]